MTPSRQHLLQEIERLPAAQAMGRVVAIKGLLIECAGIEALLSVGARCAVQGTHGADHQVLCEVVGFRENVALLMPFGSVEGVGLGARVTVVASASAVEPSDAWLGRVVDPMGNPLDGKGPLLRGGLPYLLRANPLPAAKRARVAGKMDMGVRAINTFLTTCRGKRLGIFAGSGVGKSILMSMLARYSQADVNVIGLVGERGREVQEFIEDDLGEEGLKRSVLVVATSSDSALMRRQAAYTTLAIAEYFRDQNQDVLCLMDSVTRFAMAQREIGLSAGEPPTTKGYPPTVFSELPRLLERAGPGLNGSGSITGMFTVLVEGDDTNEPIADAVRGILDGHIVLDREIAQRGRYPAINILKSVSRMLPDANSEYENQLIMVARRFMATYENMAELIRLGAYRRGTDPDVDRAMQFYPQLETFITQRENESATLAEGYELLGKVLGLSEVAEKPKASA
ncbi:MAG: flagellar protein export ATPase FliI [Alphaproteobacteria bacterium]|nr:flagellar protein export ATPase FliI [Alphaproteobacteria bacterium]